MEWERVCLADAEADRDNFVLASAVIVDRRLGEGSLLGLRVVGAAPEEDSLRDVPWVDTRGGVIGMDVNLLLLPGCAVSRSRELPCECEGANGDEAGVSAEMDRVREIDGARAGEFSPSVWEGAVGGDVDADEGGASIRLSV
jgi:hypothetical protein